MGNDNFDLKTSHVIPALVRKFYEAKHQNNLVVKVWGSGTPRREFMHVDDLADACYFLMTNYNEHLFVNVGVGEDISIKELAELVKEITGFKGEIQWDSSKPDGTPRKLMNVDILKNLKWRPKIKLKDGLQKIVQNFNDEFHKN